MKQQSFLREMSNYVFKQFCTDLDEQSLGNLLEIVATPNERAADMVEDQDSDMEDESGELNEDDSEISEDSDDL